ncbi:hypothetical protein EVAR_59826_1 [Eumeta japonica]|uniref:Uncharacterized protein n=1 Tax=Eumeta variegata TaxID=151549 RepID=A0A4C1ZCI7_EUMVA|nr:hypothetical protein EVAR_59826_1 [Eumeta japonica]
MGCPAPPRPAPAPAPCDLAQFTKFSVLIAVLRDETESSWNRTRSDPMNAFRMMDNDKQLCGEDLKNLLTLQAVPKTSSGDIYRFVLEFKNIVVYKFLKLFERRLIPQAVKLLTTFKLKALENQDNRKLSRAATVGRSFAIGRQLVSAHCPRVARRQRREWARMSNRVRISIRSMEEERPSHNQTLRSCVAISLNQSIGIVPEGYGRDIQCFVVKLMPRFMAPEISPRCDALARYRLFNENVASATVSFATEKY